MAIGTALDCEIRPSTFHRKNYFYPDQAKDYQISQYDEPINVNGRLELPDGTRVGIERAHIEEDTGKTMHAGSSGRIHGADYSLVDYNRSGVPLVEIVSAPDMRSSEQARAYVTELRAVLVASGASDGKMEEGSMRVDANVSVRRSARRSLRHPLRDQEPQLGALGGPGHRLRGGPADRPSSSPEARSSKRRGTGTRTRGGPSSLRSKEEAYDYRYFLEPDLVPLDPDGDWVAAAADIVGLLPRARRQRLVALARRRRAAGARLAIDQVATVVDLGLDDLVVEAVAAGVPAPLALSRTANEAAADAEAARRLPTSAYVGLLYHGGGRVADRHPGQGGAGRSAGRPGRRPGGRGRRPRVRGHDRGLAGLGGGRGGGGPSRRMGALPGRWRDGRQADRLLHRPGHAADLEGQADGKAVAAELRRLRG